MKFLALALILTCFGGSFAEAQSSDHGSFRHKVLEANDQALKIIRQYSNDLRNPSEMRETARIMAASLDKGAIIPAVGDVLDYCISHPNTEAEAGWGYSVISLCPKALNSPQDNLIQTFIHESYHLYEWDYYLPKFHPDIYHQVKINPKSQNDLPQSITDDSERRASIMELAIMKYYYGCVFTETTYFKKLLGLKRNKDFFICK